MLQALQQLRSDHKLQITEKEAQIKSLRENQNQQATSSQPIIDGFDGLNYQQLI